MAPSAVTVAAASRKRKREREAAAEDVGDVEDAQPRARSSEDRFRQKTLILASRGVSYRQRHLMDDFCALLPTTKKDAKLDTKHQLWQINELADLSSCNNAIYFEARRRGELYMWLARTPNGPSARFHVLNAHTMDELKMIGNCLKGSRPIVTFDSTFDSEPHWRLLKELLTHIFAVPRTARKVKPFVDHVASFSVADGKIWFRNYQILDAPTTEAVDSVASGSKPKRSKDAPKTTLSEIGPRCVLVPVKIFEGAFNGATLFENKQFVKPAAKLTQEREAKAAKYVNRKREQTGREARQSVRAAVPADPLETRRVFA